jgi:hypothetical protein
MLRLSPASVLGAATFLLAAVAWTSIPAHADEDFCNNMNPKPVVNMPSYQPPRCVIKHTSHVYYIRTYHWNMGKGSPPGTIGLQDVATGQTYGPYKTRGVSSKGVPDAYWFASVDLCLPPGTYQVNDSNWLSWSVNPQSNNQGFVELSGDTRACIPAIEVRRQTEAPAPPPTPAPQGGANFGSNPCGSRTPRGEIQPGPGVAVEKVRKRCFGPPGSTLFMVIHPSVSQEPFGPFTSLNFHQDVNHGVGMIVIAPLAGGGAKVPPQLCAGQELSNWLVYPASNVAGETKLVVGEFTINGCGKPPPGKLP